MSALLYGMQSAMNSISRENEPLTSLVGAAGGNNGGDDDRDDDSNEKLLSIYLYPESSPAPLHLTDQLLINLGIRKIQKLLKALRKRLSRAITSGNKNLALILRDRIMVITADRNDLYNLFFTAITSPNKNLVQLHGMDTYVSPEDVLADLINASVLFPGNQPAVPSLPYLKILARMLWPQSAKGRQAPRNKYGASAGDSNALPEKKTEDVSEAPDKQSSDSNSPPPSPNSPPGGNGDDRNPDEAENPGQTEAVFCKQCGAPINAETDDTVSDQDEVKEGLCDGCLRGLALKTECPDADGTPSHDLGESTFDELVERFLSIPVEDFLPLDGQLRCQLFLNAKKSENAADPYTRISALMSLAVFNWLRFQDIQQARQLFKTINDYACARHLDPGNFLMDCLLLHQYKKVLESPQDQKGDASMLLSTFIEGIDVTSAEILPLKLLFYAGALPGIEGFENYHHAFHLMASLSGAVGRELHMPVSFTALDQLRFGRFSNDVIKAICLLTNKVEMVPHLMILMMVIQSINSSGCDIEERKRFFLQHARESGINVGLLRDFLAMMQRSLSLIGAAKLGEDVDIAKVRRACKSSKSQLSKYTQSKNRIMCAFLNIVRVTDAIIDDLYCRTLPERTKHASIARCYAETAEDAPGHWYMAFSYYRKASMLQASINAAQQFASFLNQKGYPEQANYWFDRAECLEKLSPSVPVTRKKQVHASPSPSKESETISEIVSEIQAMQSATCSGYSKMPEARKKKKTKKAKTVKIAALSQKQESDNPDEAVPVAIAKPVVHAGAKTANKEDFTLLETGWSLASSKALKPHERLLSRNWNHKIGQTLAEVRRARIESDSSAERKAFQVVMNDPKHKIMIGIERIWEEICLD